MTNEIYRKLIESLYNHVPSDIQNVVNTFGPEGLYSLINPHLPYLDNFLHGASYVPYAIAGRLLTNKAFGIKREDVDWSQMKEIKKYGWGYVGLIGPFIEEALFRLAPSYIGKFIGGDTGEMVGLGISSVIFAAAHGYKYKNKKFRGFVNELISSLFFTHTYLTGGFLSSFGFHSVNNTIAYALLKAEVD